MIICFCAGTVSENQTDVNSVPSSNGTVCQDAAVAGGVSDGSEDVDGECTYDICR